MEINFRIILHCILKYVPIVFICKKIIIFCISLPPDGETEKDLVLCDYLKQLKMN